MQRPNSQQFTNVGHKYIYNLVFLRNKLLVVWMGLEYIHIWVATNIWTDVDLEMTPNMLSPPGTLQHWERGMQNGLVNLSNPLLVSTFSLLGHADDTLCNSMMPSRSITGKKSNFYCCITNLSIVFAKLSPDVFWYFLCQDYLSADSEAHDTPDLSLLPQGLAL